MRFVVVGTVRRGAVQPPRPLSAKGQNLAMDQMLRDLEREQVEEIVVWAKCWNPRVERMIELMSNRRRSA